MCKLKCLNSEQDFFFFFSSIREFMDFTSKILVERTALCSRASVKEQGEYEL